MSDDVERSWRNEIRKCEGCGREFTPADPRAYHCSLACFRAALAALTDHPGGTGNG